MVNWTDGNGDHDQDAHQGEERQEEPGCLESLFVLALALVAVVVM